MTARTALPYPTKRLKHIVSLKQSRINGNGGESLYVGLENIEPWTGKLFESLSPATMDNTVQSNVFSPGDVLFGKLRPYLAKVWVAEFAGRSTTECLVMKPVEVESRFLGYACLRRDFIDAVDASTFGSKMPRAEWGFIGNMRVPVPHRRRQRAIADYLDRETARLDALVAAKERMLELLTERRQALIAATVTGGVDAAGHAKPPVLDILNEEESLYESGTNRRGNRASSVGDDGVNITVATAQVSRRKLKHLASVNDDLLDENTDVEFEMRYIDIGNVDSSGRISEMSSFRFGDAPSRARRLVRDGDVIISTVRTYLQAITQIRNPPDNLVVSTGFAVVRPRQDRFDARYCRFALREPTFLAEVEKRSVGANYPAINVTDLADILIPVHSLPQQRAIAEYLDRETARLDTLKVKIRGTIALLKERRAAIIAAAVTGQIDVESVA